MKEYFKEQLDAGPLDDNNCMVFYIVASSTGKDMHHINCDAIDNLSEKYIFVSNETAIPIFKHKEI